MTRLARPFRSSWLVIGVGLAAAAGCGPAPAGQAATSGRAVDPWQAPPAHAEPAAARAPKPSKAKPAPARKQGRLPADAQAMLDTHNRFRAQHCAEPLAWSPALAKVAQTWADALRDKGCAFEHSKGSKYGENLAAGTSGAMSPETVVTMWYDEVEKYSFSRPGFSMETGHFTQVVWRGTTQLGCGVAQCKGMDIWVCNYDPPGNWAKQYEAHVLPRSCKK